MTITDETMDMDMTMEDESTIEEENSVTRKKRDRDFSKFRPQHSELADYVNKNSGLPPVSPQQVKAILALRTDFNNMPEQIAERELRKQTLAAERSKYEGMSDQQIKAAKSAERVERQASKLRKRLEEAVAKAEELRHDSEAGGDDLVAAVEAEQEGFDDSSSKRRFGRNR